MKELVLISQDTTRYGEDLGLGRTGLAQLVRGAPRRRRRFPWIRFLYAYPKTLHAGVFELMAKEPRFVPYVDMPLQHVSRKILAAMKRGGDAASYRKQFEEIREIVPDIALRSTFIVGFPGETERRFLGSGRVPRGRALRQRGRLHVLARSPARARSRSGTLFHSKKNLRAATV